MRQRHNIPAGKSLLLRLSVCRFFLFCCLAVFACSAFGQKVKREAVLYKNANMLAVGDMYEDKFVEDSRIKIYYVPDARHYRVKKSGDEIYLKRKKEKSSLSNFRVFADCIYYKENGEERFKGFLDLLHVTCYGTFRLYHNPYTGFAHNARDVLAFYYLPLSVDSAKARVGLWAISATKTKDGYLMRAQYKNNSYRRKDKTPIEIEGILPMEDFNVREIDNSLAFFLKKLRRAKVTLRNYDEFDGTVKIETGGSGALYCKLLNGTCKYYKTGDVFEGKYQEIYYGPDGIHVPTEGIMKLANGEQYRGDSWLTQYPDVRDFGCFFEDGDGPSEIRKLAQEKQQELNKRKAEERVRERARERAKQRAEELQMQQREREIQARRQYLINKYGYKYGRLLADDKVCLGMTKEMVSQIRDESTFSITKMDVLGDIVEIWSRWSLYTGQREYTFTNGILTSYTE